MAKCKRTTRIPIQTCPDWSHLPAELIQLISEKIIFKEQYAYLRFVCQQWRLACPPRPRHLVGQVPWVWLPHKGPNLTKYCARPKATSTFSFYDFSQSETYNFDLPGVIGKKICGYSRGWILLEEDMSLSLINPITREVKYNCLPSLVAPPTILGFARNEKTRDPLHFVKHQKLNPRIVKIILTSSPSEQGCILLAQFHSVWELGFCRIGDSSWTILKLREYGQDRCEMSDFKYKNGLIYAMSDKGQVTVYDLRDFSQKILIGDLSNAYGICMLYLVIGEGKLDGVPFVVIRSGSFKTEEFEVYQCVNEMGRSTWWRVRNIGNVILFLGHEQCEIMSLDNIQLNGWKKNHIYYGVVTYLHGISRFNVNIKMANIGNRSIKEVPTSLSVFPSYNGCTSSEYLSWFTPSLC